MESSSSDNLKHVLVGCTGSVATIKLPVLLKTILESKGSAPWNIQLQVIVTEHARHFYAPEDIPIDVPVYYDLDEWTTWSKRGDPVLHIELAKWADVFIISPLDANTLAKLAQV
jgi:phosphopantothenoylcysteine decarboxylase